MSRKDREKSFLTLMTNDLNDHDTSLALLEVKTPNAENSEEVFVLKMGLKHRGQCFLLYVLCVENKSTTNHPLSEWCPPPWGVRGGHLR